MGVSINKQKDIDGDKIIIEGGTDGTSIGNVGDRLKVDATVSASPVPSTNQVHFASALFNGSNDSMDVNGSGTAQVFEYENTSGVNEYITHINLTITDGGSMDSSDFGAVGSLSNGLLIEFEISSTDYEYSNPTNNRQLIAAFTPSGHPGGKAEDWLDEDGQFNGDAILDPPVCLADGDKVKATVRDNLTGLNDLFTS